MELINYIEYLSSVLHFDEKYFIQTDEENNKCSLICLTTSTKNNLGYILSTNENINQQFINVLLNYFYKIDNNIANIKLFINFENDNFGVGNYIGLSILFIRNTSLLNFIDILPEEIIKSILSFSSEKDVINFGITNKNYYKISNNNLLWFNIILIDFKLELKYDIEYNYKELKLCKFKYGNPEIFSKNLITQSKNLNQYSRMYMKFLLNNKLFVIHYEYKLQKINLKILCDTNEVELLKILLNNYKLKNAAISLLLNHQIMKDDKYLKALLLTSQKLTKEKEELLTEGVM